ncbi:unnamed protein product [Cercospora beticola]|nr:unnamed protein product [Cercospora beticola]
MHGSRRSQVLLLQLTPRDSLRTESVKVSVTDQTCILRASSSPYPMSTTKTIELPLGNTTAKCTIEIPDTSDDPPAPEAVVDFTYQAVAWIVKIAAEMNTTAPATSPQRSSISSSASSERGSLIVSTSTTDLRIDNLKLEQS